MSHRRTDPTRNSRSVEQRASGGQRLRSPGNLAPVGIENRRPERYALSTGVVLHLGADDHRCLPVADLGRSDIRPPVGHVDRRESDQPHMPVEAGSRIPARRFGEIFQTHGDRIPIAVVQEIRDVEGKRTVSVGALPDLPPVDIDLGVAHRPVELQPIATAVVERQFAQVVPIPSRTDEGQGAGAAGPQQLRGVTVLEDPHRLAVDRQVEGSCDGPVVRNPHALPCRSVVIRRRKHGRIGAREEPAVGQHLHRPRRLYRRTSPQEQAREQKKQRSHLLRFNESNFSIHGSCSSLRRCRSFSENPATRSGRRCARSVIWKGSSTLSNK